MAFSTQRRFQYVPFLNEFPQPICPHMEGVKLRTYASTRDERAWGLNEQEKAQYQVDLVTCRLYGESIGDSLLQKSLDKSINLWKNETVLGHSEKDGSKEQPHVSTKTERDKLKNQLDLSEEKLQILSDEKEELRRIISDNRSPGIIDELKSKISDLRKSSKIDKNDEKDLLKMLETLRNDNKAYQALNVQNNYLRKSVERLSLSSELCSIDIDPETNTDVVFLQDKVNQLRKQVAQLRSFEEKTIKKETLSKGNQSFSGLLDEDGESLIKIKAERNALRDKCESFASVEGRIMEWKSDAEQFKSFRKKACLALKQKDEEIQDCHEKIEEIEYDLKEMVKCLNNKEQEGEALCNSFDYLKEENQRLKDEICRCNCDLKAISTLQNQVQVLSNELCEKNCAIEQYDMQFQQLLGVVDDLQNKTVLDIRSLQDVDSQTNNEHIEELAVSTRATLNQITKELELRKELEADLAQSMLELETVRRESQEKEKSIVSKLESTELENQKLKQSLEKTAVAVKQSLEQFDVKANPDGDCVAEVERLQELVIKLKSDHEIEKEVLNKKLTDLLRDLEVEKKKVSSIEDLSGEANGLKKSLASVEDEKNQLLKKNEELKKNLEEYQNKVTAQKEQIEKLEQKATDLLCSSEASLKEVDKLVKDISSVQDRNENLKSVLEAVDYSEQFKTEIEDLKKRLEEETKKNQNLENQTKVLQANLDKATETINTQKGDIAAKEQLLSTTLNSQKLSLIVDEEPLKLSTKGLPGTKSTTEETEVKKQKAYRGEITTDTTVTRQSEPSSGKSTVTRQPEPNDGKSVKQQDKKSNSKLAQLQKIHEATRNVERNYYEKEIDGHRLSNEVLKKSLTKLTSKIQSSSALEFEREFRTILDNFVEEICQWRCSKNCRKLTKLQEICRKILESGIDCLAYKDLVYLHQKMSEAALKLRPNYLESNSSQRMVMCCKCSGRICQVPIVLKENEKILMEKLSQLEREIQSANDDLRKVKEEKDFSLSDTEQTDLDTLRPNSTQTYSWIRNNSEKPRSTRFPFKIQEEFEIPTKDKY